MELDLRSFLPDDIDADVHVTHHRTVDEILNDCDSSSSSSSPSPPSSPSHHLPLPHNNKPTQFPQPVPVSISRVKPDKPPRPFSSLFGRVTPNAKPGAALAAAAAASRSVPTPHAAAIISRRKSSQSIRTESDDSDKGSDLGEKIESVERKIESSESVSSVGDEGEIAAIEVNGADIQVKDDSRVVSVEKSDLDECSVSPSLNDVENGHDHDHDQGLNLSYTPFDVADNDNDDGFGEKTSLDYKGVEETEEEIVNGVGVGVGVSVSDGSVGGIENEVSGGGDDDDGGGGDDDGSSIGDVFELVEETLEELESVNLKKKKSESLKKPLDLAEELEKKNASTGLHLEEGAAAQPMRLEGVRRGSITLGYFDVDADNAITRAISSHTFRRDHGSAQVLVVHTNFIAVGMKKGLIVLVA